MAAWVRVCVYLLAVLLTAYAGPDNLMCALGKIVNTCNDTCLTNCTREESCSLDCEARCFCPKETFEFEDICLAEDECPAEPIDVQPEDKCSDYESCVECISSDPDCYWCPYVPREVSVIGSRCRLRDNNPICPVEVVDPESRIEIIKNEEFGDDVQVKPQKLRVELRARQPKEFTLQFKPSENFPLDLYFFLDATGSFSRRFRDTVPELATDLVAALNNITTEYAVGFGYFGEKRAVPYAVSSDSPNAYHKTIPAGTCSNSGIDLEDCNPTISFRHTANISFVEPDELESILDNISIHLNVDALEGGMDGLVQILTCTEKIGWRPQSLRMLLYMSNADFHLAGDGKVGAVLDPNPGVCSLEPGTEDGIDFEEYNDDTRYDYPSVYQLRGLSRTSETNIVFAIAGDRQPIYEVLSEQLQPFARLTTLEQNSSNIINVIQEAYDDISQEVRLTTAEHPDLEFSFAAGEGCGSNDTDVCTGVSIGKNVTFNVTVTMKNCLSEPTTVFLQSTAFGNVQLEIVPLCECNCSTTNSEFCNGTGNLTCGICDCPPGRSGDMCQCTGDATCNVGLDDEECSGRSRGECNCGECSCFIQERLLETKNIIEPYFGDACQCDHFTSCQGNLTEDGELCSGRGMCDCESNTCMCDIEEKTGLRYGGKICECDPLNCYSTEHNDVCVYTGELDGQNAACDVCSGCRCITGTTRGPDGTCDPLDDICTGKEECARCLKDLQSEDTDCTEIMASNECNASLVDTAPSPSVRCIFTDSDGCTHTFYIQPDRIHVENDRNCPSGTGDGFNENLLWIIPVAVIVGLLVLGAIILAIVLLIVCITDRLEYQRFKKDLEDANWDQQENPMYVSPSQQYTNVLYRKKGETKTD